MKRPAVKCVMKKPVAKTIMKKPTVKASKMKLGTSKTDANMLVRVSPCTTCSLCKGILITRSDGRPSECTIVGSESFDIAKTYRKECTHWKCRITHRANFAYQEAAKINTLTCEHMKELGFYLVTRRLRCCTAKPKQGYSLQRWSFSLFLQVLFKYSFVSISCTCDSSMFRWSFWNPPAPSWRIWAPTNNCFARSSNEKVLPEGWTHMHMRKQRERKATIQEQDCWLAVRVGSTPNG